METTLAEYLAYAPVFVRKTSGEIIYWTLGAEELYGFSTADAVGRVSYHLLQTVFPEELAVIEARLHADKVWRGRLGHTTRDGRRIWTESLWRLRRTDVVVEQIPKSLIALRLSASAKW
jgi:PAS domain S-box-containing protein